MNKKKILFLISSLSTGGAQRAFANISLNLPEGWDCDFLINSKDEVSYPHRGRVLDLGLPPQKDKTELHYLIKVFFKRIDILRRLKKSGEYAACISGLSSSNMVNALTKTSKSRTITSIRVHMSRQLENTKSLKGIIERIVVCLSDLLSEKVVAVSESARVDLIENFFCRSNSTVAIYNGYSIKTITDKASEGLTKEEESILFPELDTKLLINVGRLENQKCQFALIRIFKEIHKFQPDTRLVILGEGKLHDPLNAFIDRLGLAEDVILWGFENNPYRIVGRSHLFLMTSLFEGFPNTMVESLILGVPVISTDCDSGPREILAPNTDITQKTSGKWEEAEYGILCPSFGCDSMSEDLSSTERIFADAVCELLNNKEKYQHYRENCSERVKDFEMQNVVMQWINLIES